MRRFVLGFLCALLLTLPIGAQAAAPAPTVSFAPTAALRLAAVTPTTFTIPAFTAGVGNAPVTVGVPTGVQQLALHVDTTQHLNTGVVLHFVLEESFDSGATFQQFAGADILGGIRFGDQGETLTSHDMQIPLPNPQLTSTQRKLRVTISPLGGSFISAGGSITLS